MSSNCVETKKNYLDKLEQEEEYINLLYSLIGDIQNEIEESIKKGEWYRKVTYEFIVGNDYDEETFYKLIDDIYQYDGEDVRRYVKVFGQYNSVISNDDEVIVIDNEQKAKVTFFESGWFKWEHTIERIDK